jgi:ubiquinone biosynthesis protein
MKFSRIRRFYQLNKVFLQHGLDELIPWHMLPWFIKFGRHCFFWLHNCHPEKSQAQRIRLALEALGPVYIKFGQMLSTRRDLLSDEVAVELTKLQDNVPPFSPEKAAKIITDNLGCAIDQVFDDFEYEPMASASIAQVHSATLKENNQTIVIKVIRPDIEQIIKSDTDLMATFAALIEKIAPISKRLRPVEVVEEYKRTIFDELDMVREAQNTQRLRANFENSPSLYIPLIYNDYCYSNMLVMERIYGIPVADIDALNAQNTNLKLLAERGVEVFFTQVFRDKFFHADMHPGNVFVSRETPDNPKYIGIDCGIVGTLNNEDQRYLAENFLAFFNRDYHRVATLHVDSGWVPADTNIDDFESSIRAVLEPIFEKPLAEISFGHVLVNLFNTARRFNMEVQPQLVLLQKTLLYVEGLGRQLYPQLDLWQTAKPFLERWMKEQMGPQAFYKSVKSNAPFWAEKMPELPDLIYDNLKLHQRHQQQWHHSQRQMLKNQAAGQKSNSWLVIGSTLLICASLFYLKNGVSWHSLVLTGGGVASWLCSWRHKSNY